jgi:hypothetical protein
MACRLASVPVLTVSVLKRLQDLGIIKKTWKAIKTLDIAAIVGAVFSAKLTGYIDDRG